MKLRTAAILLNIFIVIWALAVAFTAFGLQDEGLNLFKTEISNYRTDSTNYLIFGVGVSVLSVLLFVAMLLRYRLLTYSASWLEKSLLVISFLLIFPTIAMAWITAYPLHGIGAAIAFIGIWIVLSLNTIICYFENRSCRKTIAGMVISSVLLIIFLILFGSNVAGVYSPIFEWMAVIMILCYLILLSVYYFYLPGDAGVVE